MTEGIADHWAPYWKWCTPCSKGHEFEFVRDLDHAEEDKDFLADRTGMNATIPIFNDSPAKEVKNSDIETKKK